MRLSELYDLAEKKGVVVDYFPMREVSSFSMPGTIVMDVGKFEDSRTEKVHFAHELGHCETGSFYNVYSSFDVRGRHERRANRWAIKKLIPLSELRYAIKNGITEVWELAEYFEVTNDFMEKAIEYYKVTRQEPLTCARQEEYKVI